MAIEPSACSTNTLIDGNYIGVNSGGVSAAPNGVGILISGNTSAGIRIPTGTGSALGTTIAGNLIGTNGTQTSAIPNAIGLDLIGGSGTTVGSVPLGVQFSNAISGNTVGIVIGDVMNSTVQATVEGNGIGVTTRGTALGNSSDGIRIHNGSIINIGSPSGHNTISRC